MSNENYQFSKNLAMKTADWLLFATSYPTQLEETYGIKFDEKVRELSGKYLQIYRELSENAFDLDALEELRNRLQYDQAFVMSGKLPIEQ